jgi:hypothetical protein
MDRIDIDCKGSVARLRTMFSTIGSLLYYKKLTNLSGSFVSKRWYGIEPLLSKPLGP